MTADSEQRWSWPAYLGGLGNAEGPATIVVGIGNVTGGHHPDLLLRQRDGSVVILEADGLGRVLRYVCANCFDGASIIGVADVTGNGYADLVGVAEDSDVLVFPHTGVFWPQDPVTTFGCPVVIGTGLALTRSLSKLVLLACSLTRGGR